MTTDNKSNNKRIIKNTIALYIRMLLQMFIGLYTSRIILNALGVEDYGIYNVVGSVTTMLTFINSSMSNATMRFITFELGKNDIIKQNKIFCVSLNIHIIIAIITFILLETVGVWFLYYKMVIPFDRINAAFIVLQLSILTCIISIISVPYDASIIAHEKMKAFAYISLSQSVLTLLLALILPFYTGDKLILYAIFIMIIQLIIRVIYGAYCKRHFSETRYRFIWDRQLTKDIASFAGWTMNGNIAWLGYTQGLNILINMFTGPAANAARGIAFTVQSKIIGFCDSFQTAVKPQITKTYANNEFERMHSLILMSSKYSFYLLLILSLPIYICTENILKWWLKIVPEHSVEFIRIILLCSIIDVLRNPINSAIHATGNIKVFQLIEATTLLLIVPFSYIVLKLGYDVTSVFIVQLIIFIIAQIERIFIVCPRIKMPKQLYINLLLKPMILVTISSTIIPSIFLLIWPLSNSLYQSIFYILLSIFSTIISIYLVGLNKEEKNKVFIFIKNKIKK